MWALAKSFKAVLSKPGGAEQRRLTRRLRKCENRYRSGSYARDLCLGRAAGTDGSGISVDPDLRHRERRPPSIPAVQVLSACRYAMTDVVSARAAGHSRLVGGDVLAVASFEIDGRARAPGHAEDL